MSGGEGKPDRSRSSEFDRSFSWRNGVGLVIALGVLIMFGALTRYQEEHAEQRKEAAEYSLQPIDEEARSRCNGLPGPESLLCLFEALQAHREDRQREYDLQAQQDMAEWAMVVGYTAIGSFIVGGIGLWALLRTLDATTEANRRFAESSRREQRAYLVVDGMDIEHFEEGRQPRFQISLENRGSTPARDVRWWSFCTFEKGGEAEIKIRPQGKIRLTSSRMVVGPGQGMAFPVVGEELSDDDIRDAIARRKTYIVAVVLRYRDVFGDRHWTTLKCVVDPDDIKGGVGRLWWADKNNYAT